MLPILKGLLVATVVFASTTDTQTNEYAKQRVLEVYKGIPALMDVAFCESTLRQFQGTSTEVLRGKVDKRDVGIMQINEFYNGAEAKRLGYDIYSVDGNIEMAKILYKRDGLRPWKSSFKCMLERSKLRQETE